MEDSDEPPDDDVREPTDRDGILETPNKISCNPSVVPTYIEGKGYPMLIRARVPRDGRKMSGNPRDEISKVYATFLETPTRLSEEYRVLIGADNHYAKFGTEDARAVMRPDGNLDIAAISFDGKDPRIAHYISDPELTEAEYQGIAGPRVPLKRAIDIAGKDSYYGRIWTPLLEIAKKFGKGDMLLPNKDASFYYPTPTEKGLFGRFPESIQYHPFEHESDLRRKDYWENEIANLEDRTILTPEKGWQKIGMGGPPIDIDGRKIATCHRVIGTEGPFLNWYQYFGSFFELGQTEPVATARLRDALLSPKPEDRLRERTGRGRLETIKDVAFPTAMIVEGDQIYIYYGAGDQRIRWRTTTKQHILEGLAHPHNRRHLLAA
ncbi:hypothetical protein HN935_02335 [archaeon]|jgi:hypothetical protein|nr:hypothetical protein [archaeon]